MVLGCIYLPVLLPYPQISYSSFGKPEVSLNTVGVGLDSSWHGCPDPWLNLKASTVRHGGDAELLNTVWGNHKNI